MLKLNPPLAALHGARLDHSGAVAHGFISSAEHLAAASLRLQNHVLERLAYRAGSSGNMLPTMLAMDVATDPSVQQMGAGIFQEQLHLAADLSTRMVALGEWHQHSLNAVISHWLSRFESNFSVFPAFAGVSVLQKAVEAIELADHAVSDVAGAAVQTTEVLAEEIGRVEKAARAKSGKK